MRNVKTVVFPFIENRIMSRHWQTTATVRAGNSGSDL